MKKIIFRSVTLLLFTVLVYSAGMAQEKDKTSSKDKDDDNFYLQDFHSSPGAWGAIIKNDKIHIQFGGVHWNTGRNFQLNEFSSLPATGKEGEFSLKREAGTVFFSGKFNDNKGHGTYRFEENASFKSFLTQQGFTNINEALMLHIFFTDINQSWFDFMKLNGYSPLTPLQLKDLAEHDMNKKLLADYFELFKNEGYGKVGLEKIIEMRDHGASAAFIMGFKEAGYKDIPLDKAIELVDHGVSMNFITGFGMKDITLDQSVELADHGVNPAFIKALTDMGYKDISLEKAIELVDHGVSIDFLKEFRQLGYKDITADKARDLVDHGVNPAFVKEIKAIGFPDISLDRAIELRDHGVTAEYIKKMQKKGMNNLKLEEYQKLKDAGI